MSMKPATTATLQIHFCVLLWGFTAILGKLISLPALPLVWWRMLIVVGVLALVPSVLRSLRALPARLWLAYAGIGALVALHWLTFYGAIKLANASVAATCIALAAPLTALVEPWLTRTPFSARDLLLGLAVLPGVALVVGGVPSGMREGIAVGAVSALLVAVFGSLNKRVAHRGEALMATGLELGAGLVVLTALAPLLPALMPELAGPIFEWPSPRDGALLVTLALACTLLPFWLAFVALRHISAFSAQLAINLEPVYAIVLAIVLLGEQRELTPQFYAGVAIILAAVLARPLFGRPREVAEPTPV
jgi:drug/metabolite transporter (DMT)-like permease